MIVYTNKNYRVETNENTGLGYLIRNTVTNMIEREEDLLPMAYGIADDLDRAVEKFAAETAAKNNTVLTPGDKILLPH